MTIQEKLEVLNSLEVVDHEGGDWAYVLVKKSEENIEKLKSIGVTMEQIHGYSAGLDDDCTDILAIGMELGATYYTGSKFVVDREAEALSELREALHLYWNNENKGVGHTENELHNIVSLASAYVTALKEE